MADAFGSTGMANPGVASGNTFYSDPKYVENLLKGLTGQQSQLSNYMQNPAASPLFQGQLSGLLQALVPSEQGAVTGLNDMFRAGGNTASSVYGGAAQGLQSNLLQNRQELASKLLGQSFGQTTNAMLQQMGLTPQLLNALKLSQQQGAQPQQSGLGLSPSLGLNTPMAGDAMTSTQFGGAQSNPYAQPLSGQQGYGGVNPLPPAGYGPNGSLTQTEYNSYYGPQQNQGSTMFLPGGQMVGQSTPSNNAIFDQLGGSGFNWNQLNEIAQ